VGGPCDPNTETCLPNTGGGGNLVGIALGGFGALFLGTGLMVVANDRRRNVFA
jgi:hypothetical protein